MIETMKLKVIGSSTDDGVIYKESDFKVGEMILVRFKNKSVVTGCVGPINVYDIPGSPCVPRSVLGVTFSSGRNTWTRKIGSKTLL